MLLMGTEGLQKLKKMMNTHAKHEKIDRFSSYIKRVNL